MTTHSWKHVEYTETERKTGNMINLNGMRMMVAATGLALVFLTFPIYVSPVAAADALLGSPDFRPSPERPIGWRGDGTGKYPGATPPVHWGRIATSVKNLRSQVTKPKEGETGKPMDNGIIREWLILGPVPVTNEVNNNKDILPDEAKMEPTDGDKIGNFTWKKLLPDGQTIDFRALFGVEKMTQGVAYACAYVYSESAQKFHIQIMSSGHRLLVNGVAPKDQISLQAGWNRILFRVQCGKLAVAWNAGPKPLWYLRSIFYGVGKCESENIAWSAGLPGAGLSTPVIVGDKIFVTTEQTTLCCLNKNDGKKLWMRTLSVYDLATEEEKAANPELFQKIAPLAAKLAALDQALTNGQSTATEDEIRKLMSKVDSKKYAILPGNGGEGGVSCPTPVSDGKNVYVTFHPYLIACYDLDGNRKWLYMHPGKPAGDHGDFSSSALVGGKLVSLSDRIFAVDCDTGKLAWTNAEGSTCASIVGTTLENEPLVVTPPNIYRARDGKLLSSFGLKNFGACIGTPAIGDGNIFRVWTTYTENPGKTKLEIIRLPASTAEPFKSELLKGVVIDANQFHRWSGGWYAASPLYNEGLVYCLSEDGVLSVVDVQKQEVVYQKLLDLDLEMAHRWSPPGIAQRGGAGSSPALAGKYIYIFGNHGAGVVIEPGRSFRQVARNRIENGGYPDVYESCPVFEGKRLYYRTAGALYCIEEK